MPTQYTVTVSLRRFSADDDVNIAALLQFLTGISYIPPAQKYLEVGYQEGKRDFLLALTCFQRIHLPVAHKTFEDFAKAASASISKGQGFGLF